MASYSLQIKSDDGARIRTTVAKCKDSTTFALYMVHAFAEDPGHDPDDGKESEHVAAFRLRVREFLAACDVYSDAIGAKRGERP